MPPSPALGSGSAWVPSKRNLGSNRGGSSPRVGRGICDGRACPGQGVFSRLSGGGNDGMEDENMEVRETTTGGNVEAEMLVSKVLEWVLL